MTDIDEALFEYDFPFAYLETLLVKIREDGEALRRHREEALEKADLEWATGIMRVREEPDPQPEPQPEPQPQPQPKPAPMPHLKVEPKTKSFGASSQEISQRWIVRRINAGKPTYMDLIAYYYPQSAKRAPVAYAVFGDIPDLDYDIVAQIDPAKPWAYRVKIENTDDNDRDREVWAGGFAATEEEAQAALSRMRGMPKTKSVTRATYKTLKEAMGANGFGEDVP